MSNFKVKRSHRVIMHVKKHRSTRSWKGQRRFDKCFKNKSTVPSLSSVKMTRHNARKWLDTLNNWIRYLETRSRSKDWSCALCEASENSGGEKPFSLRELVDLMFDICGQKQWTPGLSRSNERTATCSRFRCICTQPNRNNHRSSNHRTLHRGNDGLHTQSSQCLALIGKSTNSNERQHVITCNTSSKTRPSIQKACMEQPLRLAPCFIALSGGDDTIPRMAHISHHCTVARTLRTHACTHAHSRICSLDTQPHAVVTRKLCHRQIDGRIRMHRRILSTTVHKFTK